MTHQHASFSLISEMLTKQGLRTDLTSKDGVPLLKVSGPKLCMSMYEATRIASQVQFLVDYRVSFYRMDASSIELVLFAPVPTYNAAVKEEDFGPAVAPWVAALMELPSVYQTPSSPLLRGEPSLVPTEVPATVTGFHMLSNLYFCMSQRSGKWCVVLSEDQVDAFWAKVANAVKTGLVPAACVSTPSQSRSFGGTYVVCVFNEDWLDFVSVKNIREMLRDFGATDEIGYKRDMDTERGIFSGPQEWIYRD